MSLREKFNAEIKKLKGMTLKQKLDYIWGYYKIPIIVTVVAVIFVVSIVNNIRSINRNAINVIISGLPVENIEQAHQVINDAFRAYLGDEADEKDMVELDNTVTVGESVDDYTMVVMSQKLMAMVTAHSANMMIASKDSIIHFGEQGMFADLETILDADTYDKLNALGLLFTATIPEDTTGGETTPATTYVCGIDISSLDNALLTEAGFMIGDDTAIAIPVNADNEDRALEFLDLLLNSDQYD